MQVLTEVDAGRIGKLTDAGEFFWLDLLLPSRDQLEELSGLLGMHPAAIEDTREWGQLPRLDDYGDHILLIFFSARSIEGGVEPVEVHVYVSGRWIVTARQCETKLDRKRDWLAETDYDDEDEVLYHILDALADGWDPVIDEIDKRVDEVEAQVLERARDDQLAIIFHLKQDVGELLRRAHPMHINFSAQIDVIHGLEGLTHGSREWLRDVEAHLAGIASDLRRLSNDLAALTDTFFNANAYRLNRLATLITVGSVFFLVWTLVTGFFGQNFGYLTRHIDSKGAFIGYELGALVVPTIILVGVLYWRRKDWW
ncbi:MAG: magnesium transporter [Solirubrobacteraceae bacterium]|nr:magnesium transporter [Solirubrobacteraceae bacterium]